MESFTIEMISNASAQLFPGNTLSSFANFFPEATESGSSMRGCNSEIILPIDVPNCHRGKIHVF